MAWRVFTGLAGEWAWVDRVEVSWYCARQELAAKLAPFLTDECADCRQQGSEALTQLESLAAGEEFAAEVDGHDYTLTAV